MGRAHMSSSGPPEEWVDQDHDFFVAHEFVITGHAQFVDKVGVLSGSGYQVPAQGWKAYGIWKMPSSLSGRSGSSSLRRTDRGG
jgi:hypothetical protein